MDHIALSRNHFKSINTFAEKFIIAISLSSPLKECLVLHLNKLEFPSPTNNLCQVWLKWAKWLVEKKSFNFCQFI